MYVWSARTYREDIRALLKSIGQSDGSDSDVLSMLIGDLLERLGHADLCIALFVAEDVSKTFALLLSLFECGFRLELASSKSVPGCYGHSVTE